MESQYDSYRNEDIDVIDADYKADIEDGEIVNSICSNCIHEKACSFKRHTEGTVQYCNEHDIGWIIPCRSEILVEAGFNASENASDAGEIPRLHGLCSNCESRIDCALHGSESDVWFCEEYR